MTKTGNMPPRHLLVALLLAAGLSASRAPADTIILIDGTIVEGTIYRESARYVKIETASGKKTFSRKKIEKIIKESDEGSAVRAIRSVRNFSELNDIARELKNAEALYDLERFEEIPARVERLLGQGTKFDEMRIRWMLIETYERQGKWEKVEGLLQRTLADGRQPDQIRAQAHLDIFAQNPGHTLRQIEVVKGERRRAKEFLSREMRNRGKRTDALQDRDMMEAALLEYLDQILHNEEVSTEAFGRNLEVAQALAVIREEIEAGSRNVVRALPYAEELRQVETSLYKANAILPGYAEGYVLDLVRTEAEHLDEVIRELLSEVSAAYPDRQNVGIDSQTGRLTAEGRRQWREACDRFLELSRPVTQLIEHLLARVRPYPVEMRLFIKEWEDTLERVEQMRHSAVRHRDRTHA